MGACCSSNPDLAGSKFVESQLKLEAEKYRREIKLLLLGTGEAGKSTVLKQMRLIHNQHFTTTERESYTRLIWKKNLKNSEMSPYMETNNISFENNELNNHILEFPSLPETQWDIPNPELYLDSVKLFWNDAKTKATLNQLKDVEVNMDYFLNKVDRVLVSDYQPDDQDILNTRMKTTGIVETVFMMGQLNYRLVDVGGQRSERRKWIHCFDNVKALLFVTAISEYDQVLREEGTVNRIQEALTLFESIANSEWFRNTATILFLNKVDLLEQKLKLFPLKQHFPAYSGPDTDLNSVCSFFQKLFLKLHHNSQSNVYPHFTHATDTTQMKHVIESVNDIIMSQNLEKLGF